MLEFVVFLTLFFENWMFSLYKIYMFELMYYMCDLAVHNIWVRLYAIVFRVGEGYRNAWHKEHIFESTGAVACGDTNMVLGHYISFLWSN